MTLPSTSGYVFATFMLCCMCGSQLFALISPSLTIKFNGKTTGKGKAQSASPDPAKLSRMLCVLLLVSATNVLVLALASESQWILDILPGSFTIPGHCCCYYDFVEHEKPNNQCFVFVFIKPPVISTLSAAWQKTVMYVNMLMFEMMVGLFFPMMSWLKGRLVPEVR